MNRGRIAEINEIVEKKGLRKFFKNVFGSPNNNNEWARYCCDSIGIPKDRVSLIIGASTTYN